MIGLSRHKSLLIQITAVCSRQVEKVNYYANGGPISWFSVLGRTAALSACEAQINLAVMAANDAILIAKLIHNL